MTNIKALLSLKKGWDSYDADPPNELSVTNTEKVLADIPRLSVKPSVVGGIRLHIENGDRKVYIECANTGTVYVCLSDWSGKMDDKWKDGIYVCNYEDTSVEFINNFLKG